MHVRIGSRSIRQKCKKNLIPVVAAGAAGFSSFRHRSGRFVCGHYLLGKEAGFDQPNRLVALASKCSTAVQT